MKLFVKDTFKIINRAFEENREKLGKPFDAEMNSADALLLGDLLENTGRIMKQTEFKRMQKELKELNNA